MIKPSLNGMKQRRRESLPGSQAMMLLQGILGYWYVRKAGQQHQTGVGNHNVVKHTGVTAEAGLEL